MRHASTSGLAGVVLLALMHAASAQAVSVEVISSPPDLVSPPDVLVRVSGTTTRPEGWASNDTLITPFYQAKDGGWYGLIGHGDYLIPGVNLITVVPNSADPSRQITFPITVHDADQPLFGAPRLPGACSAQGLGVSATPGSTPCDRTRIEFIARTADGAWNRLAESGNPTPATLTTGSGQKAPAVVRVEQGVVDGAPYALAFLDDPASSAEPWPAGPSPAAWNGTLVYVPGGLDGATTSATHSAFFGLAGAPAAPAAAACSAALVAEGYAVAAIRTPVGPASADAAVASALLRVKERFIKTYGLPTQTVAVARSADEQTALSRIARAYPGLDAVADSTSAAATAAGAPHCQ